MLTASDVKKKTKKKKTHWNLQSLGYLILVCCLYFFPPADETDESVHCTVVYFSMKVPKKKKKDSAALAAQVITGVFLQGYQQATVLPYSSLIIILGHQLNKCRKCTG